MSRFVRVIWSAAGAAALAWGLVGLGEALHLWILAGLSSSHGFGTAGYAFGVHGLLGLLGGALLGAALFFVGQGRLARLGEPQVAAGLSGGLSFAAGALVIGTFRLTRDGGLSTFAALAVAGFAGLLLGAAVGWALGRLARAAGQMVPAAALVAVVILLAGGRAALAPTGTEARDAEGAASPERPNVILVVVDTLRADSTGPWGGRDAEGRSLTPHLDAFAAEAIRFERMYANATWTRPAVTSILTGLLPSGHRVTQKADPLPAELPNIATSFQGAGYATAATVTNVNLAPDFGFGAGFDAYRYHGPSRPLWAVGPAVRLSIVNVARLVQERLSGSLVADRFYAEGPVITADALDLADQLADGPFYLWVHYMDPHDPFFRRPYDGSGVARVRTPHPHPDQAGEMRALYDAEVTYWDEAFGGFIAGLRERGLLDHTLVAVTADHGEEFQDHGGFWHGQTLFDELSRVPLLVRLPGARRGGETDTRLVSQVDLAPSLLSAAGLEVPAAMVGHDVLSREGSGDEVRTVIMEEDHDGMVLKGIVWDRYKYVVANPDNWRGLPLRQLFDLQRDRREHHDLAGEESERVADLDLLLRQRLQGDAATPAAGRAGPVEIDPALQEDLKSLGYVQ